MSKIKRKHIRDIEYFTLMEKYVKGILTDKEIKDLEEDIKSWELFRITGLVGMSLLDIDGIPTPILQKKMSDVSKWGFNGGEDENSYINCFDVKQFTEDEDNEKLHKSVGENYKNVGEYYRTLKHQSMLYHIHFKMNQNK